MKGTGWRFAPLWGFTPSYPQGKKRLPLMFRGAHGGNLDCKELAAGSTIYFPVFHEGALFP